MVSNLMEASMVRINLNNYNYDLAAMAEVANPEDQTCLRVQPQQPHRDYEHPETSWTLSYQSCRTNAIVVIDEAYGDYVESTDYPHSLDYVRNKKNVIVCRTFSKIYGLAGLRVGYAVAKPEIIKYLNLVRLPVLGEPPGPAGRAQPVFRTCTTLRRAKRTTPTGRPSFTRSLISWGFHI